MLSDERTNALVDGDPGRTADEERLAALVAELRAAPPAAPERLRERVAAIRPVERRRFELPAPRVAAAVALATLVAIAAAAALVHGLTRSGTQAKHTAATPETRTVPQFERSGGSGGGGALAAPHAPATTVPQSAKTYDAVGAPAVAGRRLTRYEASIRVRVPNVDRLADATAHATRIARGLGGYASSVEYRTPQGRPGQAFLELRIPAARVQTALADLTSLGTLLSQRVLQQDLQRVLEREQAQLAQLRRAIALYEQALRDPSLTPVQRVQLQLKLGEAKRALAQRTHATNATIAEGSLARVSLVLTTAKKVAPAVHHSSRLGRILGDSLSYLAVEATVAVAALIVASPLLLLAALVWFGARTRRRREEQRLLAA